MFCWFSPYSRGYKLLWSILILSLILNLWGIRWGAPKFWHPDEITDRAISMVAARSINPHHFAYGGFHYYVLGGAAVIPVYVFSLAFDPPPPREDSLARGRWWQPRITSIVVISRIISGLMSVAVVYFTYVMGQTLFNRQTGYFAALLLSISMPFVAVAHFATVDSPANFWYWLSCLCGLLVWKKGNWRWYVLAAVAAGFAIGIKVDRLTVLLPLGIALFLRGELIYFRKVSAFIALIAAGYFAGNLAIFTSFFEFAEGFTRDLFYNALRQGAEGSSHTQVLHDLVSGLGFPLFVAVNCGLAYGLYDLARGRNVAAVLWLLATILPYFFLFGSMGVQQWYLPFFFPALMILTARVCTDLLSLFPKSNAYIANATLIGLVLYTLLYAIALDLQFSNDSRYLAAKWIIDNVPTRAKVEVGGRGPSISEDNYRIVYSNRDAGVMDYALENRKTLENHPLYTKVRQTIIGLEAWTDQTFGLQVRQKPYTAWFDNPNYRKEPRSERPSIFQADYVVLIQDLNPKKIQELMVRGSGYRLAAQFQFVSPFRLRPAFPFVNPPVYIFQRIAKN